jgi:hypothetical protein
MLGEAQHGKTHTKDKATWCSLCEVRSQRSRGASAVQLGKKEKRKKRPAAAKFVLRTTRGEGQRSVNTEREQNGGGIGRRWSEGDRKTEQTNKNEKNREKKRKCIYAMEIHQQQHDQKDGNAVECWFRTVAAALIPCR